MSKNIPARAPMNVKVLRAKIDRHDSLLAEIIRLTDESGTFTADTSPRKIAAHDARFKKALAQFRALADQPEVNAAILKREARQGCGRAA